MTPERWRAVKAEFDAVLEADPTTRQAVIRDRSAGDAEMESELMGLLKAHERAGTFLEGAAAEYAASEEAALPLRLGPWRVHEEIGRGGMATVYRAERADGEFEKQVAVKVLRLGIFGEGARRQFLRERQLLAQLDHPNIVGLLDGGVTQDGRPYLVEDLVDGPAITQFAREHELNDRQRAELLLPICHALAYAHARGVIHRDVKPSNILVTSEGVPKLVDFGIARMLNNAEEARTQTHERYWTPEYASPEQARGEAVTARSDVYSLGLVLYELLGRRRAFSPGDAPQHELVRRICDAEPDWRPVKGHVVEVIRKALAKNPQHRYMDAGELAADLARCLQGERVYGPVRVGQGWVKAAVTTAVIVVLAGLVWGALQLYQSRPVLVRLTQSPWREVEPNLSPNQKELIYVAVDPILKRRHLRIVDLVNGENRVLTEQYSAIYSPRWSPDGRTVGLVNQRDGKREWIRIDTGNGRQENLGDIRSLNFAWWPDGRSIVTQREEPGVPMAIHRFDLEARQLQRLTTPPAGYWGDIQPIVSAQGGHVAFVRYPSPGAGDIYVQRADGSDLRQLTREGIWINGLTFTPDGKELLFFGTRKSGRDGLWRIPVEGPVQEPISVTGTNHMDILPAAPLRPGSGPFHLAFEKRIWLTRLRVASPGDSTSVPPFPFTLGVAEHPDYAPDGESLAASLSDHGYPQIVLLRQNQPPRSLTNLKGSFTNQPRWSPAGDRIAFTSDAAGQRHIYVMKSDGSEPPRRLTNENAREERPSWSPDGRWIYYSTDRAGTPVIARVPADGGRPEVLVSPGYRAFASPDGKTLYYLETYNTSRVMQVGASGGEARAVPGVPRAQGDAWGVTPEGIYVLDQSGPPSPARVLFFRFANSKVESLMSFPLARTELTNGCSLRRDGGAFAFVHIDPDEDVWMIRNFR